MSDVSSLDLGCGTGLAGEQLHKLGYKNVDGLDLSQELLEVAQANTLILYIGDACAHIKMYSRDVSRGLYHSKKTCTPQKRYLKVHRKSIVNPSKSLKNPEIRKHSHNITKNPYKSRKIKKRPAKKGFWKSQKAFIHADSSKKHDNRGCNG